MLPPKWLKSVVFDHGMDERSLVRRTWVSSKNGDESSVYAEEESSDRQKMLKVDWGDDFEDPSGWISGLGQWPLYPSRTDATISDPDISSKSVAPRSFPLSHLLNREVLLAFASHSRNAVHQTEIPVSDAIPSEVKAVVPLTSSADDTLHNETINVSFLEELRTWDTWVGSLKQNIEDISGEGSALGRSGDLLRQATSRVENLLADASSVVSPATIQATLRWAGEAVQNQTASNSLIESFQELALDRGLNESEATNTARQTSVLTADLVKVADGILRKGYVEGDPFIKKNDFLAGIPSVPGSQALFAGFSTAVEMNTMSPVLAKDAEMGALSGAVYMETIERTQALHHSIVAKGTTENVVWMVTDSISNNTCFQSSPGEESPFIVRTITIRGFDASDDTVDREELVNCVCMAAPTMVDVGEGVYLHSGLRSIAKAIYRDIAKYIHWTADDCKIVLNGHSIGGSLAILIAFEIALENGSKYLLNKVKKVYTYGSPAIASLVNPPIDPKPGQCYILSSFGLPSSFVSSYVQPWDPIVRLFSNLDPLYPLVEDLGADGVTPWVNGPSRTLRPVAKAIVEAWEGWPRFRENIKVNLKQTYITTGTPFIMLPDPTRYLADRYFSVNIPVPEVETIVKLSPHEVYPALEKLFRLDVFDVSLVPQAIRSFVHHFFPAYDDPLVDYVKRLGKQRGKGIRASDEHHNDHVLQTRDSTSQRSERERVGDWPAVGQWFQA